jgi:SOS-response transcriptional repressor LexA
MMAPTSDPYVELLNLIDGRIKCMARLAMLNRQKAQSRDGAPAKVGKEIKKEENNIAKLATDIEAAANKVIQSPLTFDLPRLLSLIDRPGSRFEGSLRDIIQAMRDDTNVIIAGEDCKRACDLLEEEYTPSPYARALLYLLCAEVFKSKGPYEGAELLTNCALENMPLTDLHLATVAYLIQGNVNERPAPFKAKVAYQEALDQLEALYNREKGSGYPQKEISIEEIRKSVKRRITDITELEKAYPKGSQQTGNQRLESGVSCHSFCHCKENSKTVKLPILGKIAAGEPINHQVEDWLPPLPESQVRRANFALKVQGQSMVKAGINDGDYVLMMSLDKNLPADYSDLHRHIVAAEISGRDDEATLKRLFCEGYDYLVLWPENDTETVRIILRRPKVDVKKLEGQIKKWLAQQGRSVKIEFINRFKVNDVRIRAKAVARYDPKAECVTKL